VLLRSICDGFDSVQARFDELLDVGSVNAGLLELVDGERALLSIVLAIVLLGYLTGLCC
jgi:hypothetical protein